jgi:phosphoribosylformylglycinamidine cyclo-ligase
MKASVKAYAAAGVDIDLGNKVKSQLPKLLQSTHRRGVLGKVGGFGGLFALDTRRYRQPVLVSSVDGVGTKLKVAFALDRHDTIGQDLVNHCVNDIAVLGAEPLFFLDYLGTGKLEPHVFKQIIEGFAKACAENRCALIGGETAQMPGFYHAGEYDVSGTIVGVVEKSQMLDGTKSVRPGDRIIGLPSSGLHTNGYSLARQILFERMGLKPKSFVDQLRTTVGEELLKIHRSYGPLVRDLLAKFNRGKSRSSRKQRNGAVKVATAKSKPVKALAHITGGGFVDNIPRVLPKDCDAVILQGSWPVLPIFSLLQEAGQVSEPELYQVFNMGIGMVVVVSSTSAKAVLGWLQRREEKAWDIGEIVPGRGVVQMAAGPRNAP